MDFNSIYYYKARNLNNVYRFSGNILIRPESTSSHLYDMISLAIYLNDEFIKQNNESKGIGLKDIIYRIVLHDLDEALYCDIPRGFKYDNKELTDQIQYTVEKLIANTFSSELTNDILNAKNTDTIAGTYVKILDIAQCSLVLYREVSLLGNKELTGIYYENAKYLDDVIEKYLDVSEVPEIQLLGKFCRIIYKQMIERNDIN